MKQSWYRGHVGRFWAPDHYTDLNYVRQPITDEEVQDWKNKGYDYVKSFTGMMYDNRNPMPEFVNDFRGLFDYKNLTFTFYKMSTLEIMPTHVDHFRTYMKLFDVKNENVVRILVMLEDWKPGHYLEIDGVGITDWIGGDYFVWDSHVAHAAANIGVEDRYTLQITATKIQGTDVWQKLHWYNIPNLESKRESYIDNYLTHIQNYFKEKNENFDYPTYVYMYNGQIKELENIEHDSKTIKKLNTQGIHFYLYEPLCSYIVGQKDPYLPSGTKHTRWFYTEFTEKFDKKQLRADELDSIEKYIKTNKLKNVTVHTGDYQVEKFYPHYKSCMNLICDDLFVQTCRPIKPYNLDKSKDFTKKFISANWRYTPHRHIIAAIVSLTDSHYSWYYKSDFSTMAMAPWYNLHEWKNDHIDEFFSVIKGVETLNKNCPVNLDLKIDKPIHIKFNNYFIQPFPNTVMYDNIQNVVDGDNNALENFYNDVFCDIVTESRFAQPTANYSEKVHQPMFYKKPFILVAPPYTLKYLREQGYKTFSEFWDESYDEETNHEKRLLKIIKLIFDINKKSIDELKEIYSKMEEILDHNNILVNVKVY